MATNTPHPSNITYQVSPYYGNKDVAMEPRGYIVVHIRNEFVRKSMGVASFTNCVRQDYARMVTCFVAVKIQSKN